MLEELEFNPLVKNDLCSMSLATSFFGIELKSEREFIGVGVARSELLCGVGVGEVIGETVEYPDNILRGDVVLSLTIRCDR